MQCQILKLAELALSLSLEILSKKGFWKSQLHVCSFSTELWLQQPDFVHPPKLLRTEKCPPRENESSLSLLLRDSQRSIYATKGASQMANISPD